MTKTTLVLTQENISRLIDMRTAISVTRDAFMDMARGKATMPSKIYLPLARNSDFRAMPAYLAQQQSCGLKWVNVHPQNRAKGLPSVMALIIINDPATGFPLAIMDGILITKLRTAAAAAVAAKTLARPESKRVALVGCGAQADAQILALVGLLRISRVDVWGYKSAEAKRFCESMRRKLRHVLFEPCNSLRGCVKDADIVVTVTPSRRPLIQRSWIRAGTHINAIGADAPGKQELDARILNDAVVIVDERKQAIHGGEINVPIKRNTFKARDIHATLGEVLIGKKRGRQSERDLTVFDSTGLAIHDVALGFEAFKRAKRNGIGRRIAFFIPR